MNMSITLSSETVKDLLLALIAERLQLQDHQLTFRPSFYMASDVEIEVVDSLTALTHDLQTWRDGAAAEAAAALQAMPEAPPELEEPEEPPYHPPQGDVPDEGLTFEELRSRLRPASEQI